MIRRALLTAAAICLPAVAFAKFDARFGEDDLVRLPPCAHAPWWAITCLGILALIALLESLRLWWGR